MKRVIREILSTSLYLLIVLVLTLLVIKYVGQRTVVSGSSMEATLSDRDSVIVDKISYRFQDPERFDIIVFPFQYADHTYYIKRIIGLPGETVYIDYNGTIYINGEVLEENFGLEQIKDPGLAYMPITLGQDEFFVLGDNRNNSSDSRVPSVGNIKKSSITGKAFVRIWPLNKITSLKGK